MKKIFCFVMATVVLICGVMSVAGAEAEVYTKPETFLYGDVDMDGVLTVKDVTCLQKGLAGLEYITAVQRYLAEPEKGNVTVKNATAIQKHIAGLEVAVPLGEEFVMASQDEFISSIPFEEDRGYYGLDGINVETKNIEDNYTIADFPEYSFERIKMNYFEHDRVPDVKVYTLYLSVPGEENLKEAIEALAYRLNIDLKSIYLEGFDPIVW